MRCSGLLVELFGAVKNEDIDALLGEEERKY
jgi:hypothetical protein